MKYLVITIEHNIIEHMSYATSKEAADNEFMEQLELKESLLTPKQVKEALKEGIFFNNSYSVNRVCT